MLRIIDQLAKLDPSFSLPTPSGTAIAEYKDVLPKDDCILLRWDAGRSRSFAGSPESSVRAANGSVMAKACFGRLLTQHHAHRISTPTIDRMLSATLAAGALGGKINGSGGAAVGLFTLPTSPKPKPLNAKVVAPCLRGRFRYCRHRPRGSLSPGHHCRDRYKELSRALAGFSTSAAGVLDKTDTSN